MYKENHIIKFNFPLPDFMKLFTGYYFVWVIGKGPSSRGEVGSRKGWSPGPNPSNGETTHRGGS